MRFRRALLPSLILILALLPVACSDSTAPSSQGSPDGGAIFDGAFDAGDGSFVLKRINASLPGHEPVRIELIGSNIQLDETNELVSVDVAMRNLGPVPLYSPATLWLEHFSPETVAPTNADYTADTSSLSTNLLGSYGYDYSDRLGEDGVLSAEEISETKTWVLHDPGLGSFGFAARAVFGMEPDRPVIGGYVFRDENRNGVRERNELPYRAGGITVEFPDGSVVHAAISESGNYWVPVKEPGLYRVRFTSMLECIACWCETTPNPLEVLLTPDENGAPRSFETAHFGIYPGPCWDPHPQPVPPVTLTDLPPGDIDQDFYHLLGASLTGELFRIRVGYSGCSDEHPFELYAGRAFMESMPVQTWMLLAHDDLDELCDAYFERTLTFDLAPIQDAHIEDYGEPGIIQIRFRDYLGQEKIFTLQPNFIRVSGTITNIVDDVPVDGGVTIDLVMENGESARLLFGSMYTAYEQPLWRGELYQVLQGLEVGDRVRALGREANGGIELRMLTVLD